MTNEKENWSIVILWGERPERDANAIRYVFDTPEELDAFTLGIAEMDGWMGWQEIDCAHKATRVTDDDDIVRNITNYRS